jgi:hypothetical protein
MRCPTSGWSRLGRESYAILETTVQLETSVKELTGNMVTD